LPPTTATEVGSPSIISAPPAFRGAGVGNVDETDAAERAVGIDQCHAIFAGRDDLRRGDGLRVLVGRQIGRNREAGDAVEDLLGDWPVPRPRPEALRSAPHGKSDTSWETSCFRKKGTGGFCVMWMTGG